MDETIGPRDGETRTEFVIRLVNLLVKHGKDNEKLSKIAVLNAIALEANKIARTEKYTGERPGKELENIIGGRGDQVGKELQEAVLNELTKVKIINAEGKAQLVKQIEGLPQERPWRDLPVNLASLDELSNALEAEEQIEIAGSSHRTGPSGV